MRFSSPVFLQQAVARGGVILEGDGEVTLPPVLQPTVFISSPFRTGLTPPSPARMSFIQSQFLNATGVDITTTASFTQLSPGLWRVQGIFVAAFTGTTDITAASGLSIQDTNANGMVVAELAHVNGNTVSVELDLWLPIADGVWNFFISRIATVALDNVRLRASLFFHKVL